MDQQKLRNWEHAVDIADQSPITSGLPEAVPVGTFYTHTGVDGVERKWLRVLIISGNVGGRWAYWAHWKNPETNRDGIGPHPKHCVIADKIFNGDVAHFVGMLGIPYVGKVPNVDSSAWVLVEPKVQGPTTVHVQDHGLRIGEQRYERSKEVYDVETGESEQLP